MTSLASEPALRPRAQVTPASPAHASSGAGLTPDGLARLPLVVTAILGVMIVLMSSTMVNIAIPDVMGAFGIGQDQAHWMSTGFLSAMTVSMLANAWFFARFGARTTFVIAMLAFSAAATVAYVVDIYILVVASRIAQGFCAGLLQPLGMAMLMRAFPPEERGKAMGIFGMGVVLGPTFGPTVGGLIIDELGWEEVFIAPVPVCLLVAGLASVYLPGRDPKTQALPFNLVSFVLVTTAVFSALLTLSNGQRLGWGSDFIIATGAVAIGSAAAFVLAELSSSRPLVKLTLFTDPPFLWSSIVGVMVGAGLFGSVYLLPLLARSILRLDATSAGMMLLPSGLCMVVIFSFAGRLAQRIPAGFQILVGLALFGGACAVMTSADAGWTFAMLAFWAAFGRTGLGLIFPALGVGGLKNIPPENLQFGTGAMNFSRQLGGALGVGALAIMIEQRTQHHFDQLSATQTGENPQTQELLRLVTAQLIRSGVAGIDLEPQRMLWLDRMIDAQARTLAYQDAFVVLSIGFALAMLPALLLTRR